MPQALLNFNTSLQSFNPNKFIVYSSTLVFTILLSLKLDHKISVSYWLVFLPLWIWKSITLLGLTIGLLVWVRNPEYRKSESSIIHFNSMCISSSLQTLLFIFEYLICDKLENKHGTWLLAFSPLLVLSFLALFVCIWSVKYGRGLDLEFFAATNILQILLIAFKMDNLLNWPWLIVFTPSWIILCFVIVFILYAMIFAAIVFRSTWSGQSRTSILSAYSSSMIFLPMLVFLILLTSKLDSPQNSPNPGYFITCVPLFVTLTILIRLSFGSKTGSLWWFGMRSDFCTFLLANCPCLKEYGNTFYILNHRPNGATVADSGLVSGEDSSIGTVNQISNFQDVDLESNYLNLSHQHGRDPSQILANPYEGQTKRLFRSFTKLIPGGKAQKDLVTNPKSWPMSLKLDIDAPD